MNTGIMCFCEFWTIVLAAGLAASAAAQPSPLVAPVAVAPPQSPPVITESLRRLPSTDVTLEATAIFGESEEAAAEAGDFPGARISVACETIGDAEPPVAPDGAFPPPIFEPLPSDQLKDDDGTLIQIAPDPIDPWCDGSFGRYSYRGSGSPPVGKWLPGSGDRMGILTMPFGTVTPLEEGKTWFVVGGTWHLVSGPKQTDMPPHLWDFTAHFGRRNRLDTSWSYDVALRLGWFSDFEGSAREGLRFPGHGVLYYTPSNCLQLLAGVDYLDRDDIAWLPVFGAVFKPQPDFRVDAVFPRPRVAYRFDGQRWLYLAAEMGGGTWAIRRADWSNDVATYRDYRLCLGVQPEEGSTGYMELGYVFARHLEYRSGTPSYGPLSTTMLRFVTCY